MDSAPGSIILPFLLAFLFFLAFTKSMQLTLSSWFLFDRSLVASKINPQCFPKHEIKKKLCYLIGGLGRYYGHSF